MVVKKRDKRKNPIIRTFVALYRETGTETLAGLPSGRIFVSYLNVFLNRDKHYE